MTGILYADSIEEFIELIVERQMYNRHANQLIRLSRDFQTYKNKKKK